MMPAGLEALLPHAQLRIHEYDIHERLGLSQCARRMPHHGMSYLQEGTATVRMHGQEWTMRPGSVALFPAGVLHDHVAPAHARCVFLWWNYDFRIAEAIDLLRFIPLPTVFDMPLTAGFESAFRHYVHLAREPDRLSNVVMRQAKALEVMAFILDAAMNHQRDQIMADRKTWQTGLAAMTEPFARMLGEVLQPDGPDVSLHALSQRHNLNPTYVSNRFRTLFGTTPAQLHRKVLLDRALTLLRQTAMGIREVAEVSGYADEASFSKAFHRQHGQWPGQAR
jgi:AraC family transcriptional regulator, arabinose operon regulatory protein